MKVLFINALYTPNLLGGAERVIQSLAEGLVRAGHQAVVISAAWQKRTQIDYVNGVKVYYVGLKNFYWPYRNKGNPTILKPIWHALDTYNPWMAYEVARILDLEHPDVVNTSTITLFSASVSQPVKRRGLPLVHTLQDYYLLCPRATMFRDGRNCNSQCARCRVYATPRRHFANQVDVVIGASQRTLERHLNSGYFSGAPEKRVIYNAHEIEATEISPDRGALPIRFGFLGRLSPTKGLEILLESAAHLPSTAWSLNIGGKGLAEYEGDLRAKYRMPNVRFSGYVNPEEFFSQIDVLVVPSLWHDPSPRVINEAYARGVPVIGSNRGGIPELVEEGRTGFVFDPTHPGGLAMKMYRYLSEPSLIEYMRPACLIKAKSFLPDNIVEQYQKVYSEIDREK